MASGIPIAVRWAALDQTEATRCRFEGISSARDRADSFLDGLRKAG